MTGEILGIVGDNIDSSRILWVTKINNRIPRVTKLPALLSFLPHFAIYNWCNNYISIITRWSRVPGCWATVETGQSLSQSAYKGQSVPAYTSRVMGTQITPDCTFYLKRASIPFLHGLPALDSYLNLNSYSRSLMWESISVFYPSG